VPIFTFKTWIRWNPRKKTDPGFDANLAPGALIWRTNDHTDPRVKEAQFGPNGEAPLATTYMNFLSLFEGINCPVIVAFSKTSYKAGKQLLSLAKFAGGDMFSRVYSLRSVEVNNDQGTFFVLSAMQSERKNERFAYCEQIYNEYAPRKHDIVTDVTDEGDTHGDEAPF
jgi:hypothetical protein